MGWNIFTMGLGRLFSARRMLIAFQEDLRPDGRSVEEVPTQSPVPNVEEDPDHQVVTSCLRGW